jgi:type IV pilus assembly protein PilY1
MRFVHVHEYDDIYDRIGLSMLHPSQDLQRLRRVKDNETTTSNWAPDTNTHVDNDTLPTNAVQVSQTATNTRPYSDPGRNTTPAATYDYTYTAVTKSAPVTTMTATGRQTVTTEKYTTTRIEYMPINKTNTKPTKYDLRTTKHTWDTTRTTTVKSFSFKVLVANQAYSPAITLTIKDGGATPLATGFDAKAYTYQSTAGLTAASLPIYDADKLSELKLSMPLDAFNIRDWGTGTVRTGVHPARYLCTGVGSGANGPVPGPLGEWRNGVLTVQIVEPDVADSDIQLNVAGKPELGYRLKNTSFANRIIAEYLIYWHHPDDVCYGKTGWSMKPKEDTSTPTALEGKPATGSDDPIGEFKPGGGTATPVPVNPAPLVVKNQDGTTTTTTIVYTGLSSGGYTKTTTVTVTPPPGSGAGDIQTGGVVNDEGVVNTGGIDHNGAMLGRINWRELQK